MFQTILDDQNGQKSAEKKIIAIGPKTAKIWPKNGKNCWKIGQKFVKWPNFQGELPYVTKFEFDGM